jgi:hypothetical protein
MPDISIPAAERILDPVKLPEVPPTIPQHLTEADVYGNWRCVAPGCGEMNHDPRPDLTEGPSEQRAQRVGRSLRWERAERSHGEIKLGQLQRTFIREPSNEPPCEGVEPFGSLLCHEADEIQGLGEFDDAQLARSDLGHEKVLALDCAMKDCAWVALGRQFSPFRGRTALRLHGVPARIVELRTRRSSDDAEGRSS